VATRRDLSDDDVIRGVASAVGSLQTLQLLAALTEADSLATGPSAWGPWKAELLGDLVDRVAHVLRGGAAEEVRGERFPGPEVRALLARGEQVVRGEGDLLTVVARDRPGLFSRVAGGLTLRGLTVLSADAASTDDGMAASQFRVLPDDDLDWTPVVAEVRRALDGRVAIEARLADRARAYRRSSAAITLAAAPTVRLDNAGSGSATIVEVRAPDRVGVLWRITRAIADLDLDIRLARVSTLGSEVVDVFYVQDGRGQKVADRDHQRELERAILHALG
jgi:[protein-PII] uridylyltransferase